MQPSRFPHSLPLLSPLSSLLCFLLLVGCGKREPEKPVARPLEGVALRLSVADDPALAAAIERVRGEWNAQTGSELSIEEISEKDLVGGEGPTSDAVVCASHLLTELASRDWPAPVPARVLRGAQWGEVFELPKLREAAWGRAIVAVPFGTPALVCYYRADLLEKLGRRPPRTWPEYRELAQLLASEKQADPTWCGAIEPLAPGWAGLTLLARAAPYAKHRDNYSTLFDIATMEPMIGGPPFVQALEELVETAKFGPKDPQRYDPTAVREAFWRGQCGMALSWPTASREERGERREESKGEHGARAGRFGNQQPFRVGLVDLPGSPRVFNLTNRAWDRRADGEDTRVTLLSISGRLGMVNKQSAHCDAAFQLLLWLSDGRMSEQISASSPATTLFCRSNLATPGAWVERPLSADAAVQYAETIDAAMRRQQWLGALALPGCAEYLAALAAAATSALRGETPPLEALLAAETQWRKITDRLGRDRQRAAYRRSLGLE